MAYDLPELMGYRAMVSDLVGFIEQQVNYQELLQWTLCQPNLEKVGCELRGGESDSGMRSTANRISIASVEDLLITVETYWN